MKLKIFVIIMMLMMCRSLNADFGERGGLSGRASGMGNSFVGLSDDVFSIMYNPGGLNCIKGRQLGCSYRKLYLGLDDGSDIGENFIGYVHPIKFGPKNEIDYGVVGLGMLNFSAKNLYRENTIVLSYSRNIQVLPLNLGINLKIMTKGYSSTLYTENAIDFLGNSYGRDPVFEGGYGKTVYGIDLGGYYKVIRGINAGLMLKNVNMPDTGLKSETKLPIGIKAGGSIKFGNTTIMMDCGYEGNDLLIMPGMERWFLGKEIGLRGGMQLGSRGIGNISLGGSYMYNGMIRLDYSFILPISGIKDTYGTHNLSTVIYFDEAKSNLKIVNKMKRIRNNNLRKKREKEREHRKKLQKELIKAKEKSQLKKKVKNKLKYSPKRKQLLN